MAKEIMIVSLNMSRASLSLLCVLAVVSPTFAAGHLASGYVSVVRSATSVKPGKYTLTPQNAVTLRLDATDRSKTNGKQLQLWKSAGNPNQAWIFTKGSGGWYKIAPSYAPNLAVSVNANSAKNGTPVVLWADTGSAGQRWALKQDKGGYSLVPKCAPGSRMDVTGWGGANGVKIQIWSATGGKNQTWAIGTK